MKRQMPWKQPPPDVSDYGPKGNLSLGEDLRKWFQQCVADTYFDGTLPGNSFLWMGKDTELADAWAADKDLFVSGLGKIAQLNLSPFGGQDLSGQLYRLLREQGKEIRRYARAQLAATYRSRKSLEMAIEEAKYATPIFERSKKRMSMSSLATIVARHFRRRPESVRKRLTQVFGPDKPRKTAKRSR